MAVHIDGVAPGTPKISESAKIIAQINKDKGGAVVIPGSSIPVVERIPTGMFEFDLRTGGGFPRGRYSIIYGPESSGKTNACYCAVANAQRMPEPCNKAVWVDLEGCVAADSRFMDMTTGRVMTAQAVFDERIALHVRSYDDETGTVCVEPLADWIDNGMKPVLSIQTHSAELRITENHKLWVKKNLAAPAEWVRADALEVGWYVASPNADTSWEWGPTLLDTTTARFFGLMIGDGSFGGGGSPTFSGVDTDVIEDLRGILQSWGGDLITYDDRHHRLTGMGKASKWHPARAAILLRAHGLWGVTGADKQLPTSLFHGDRDAVCHVLAGLYLTDGSVSKVRPSITFSNTSLTLVEQVRELWRRLGVQCSIHVSKMYSDLHAQQYTVSINGIAALKKVAEALPLYGYKKQRLDEWALQSIASDSSQSRVGAVGLSKFKRGLIWSEIVCIEDAGVQQTYDFTVLRTHNYVVNDIVAHNTFDPAWAAMFGVDVDALILVKPAYGEEMVDMVDALLRADDVMILVVDSLGVVVSTKEIEQSAEKFDVGTASILVKRLCGKIVMGLEAERRRGHRPAVILINQTRFKIGVMFGDPEKMPGGQTMLFLSSLTIRVYGKNKVINAISPDLAAFKETHAVIKKAKVPVTGLAFDYDMCVYPHDGLNVGETRSWNMVSGDLKALGHLTKSPKGWKLIGGDLNMEQPTLVTYQDTYEGSKEFALKCQALILDSYKGKMFLVEGQHGGSQV